MGGTRIDSLRAVTGRSTLPPSCGAGSPAAPVTILGCAGTGSGGDLAGSRGIRFTVDQQFNRVVVRLNGSAAGNYSITAELRRSTGFLGLANYSSTSILAGNGDLNTTPYPNVVFDFGLVPVTGSETFTLKFIVNSGPGTVYMEVFGIGTTPCPGVQQTNENDVASPTERGDPPGFRVIYAP